MYVRTLWNGQYLHYDSSSSTHHDSIMADMMAGELLSVALKVEVISVVQLAEPNGEMKCGTVQWSGVESSLEWCSTE